MKSKFTNFALASGLSLIASVLPASAVDSTLKLELKCFFQERLSTSGDTTRGKVDFFRIDSKQLIILLSRQLGIQYYSGSQLEITTEGVVRVVNSKGTVLADASPYLKAKLDTDSRITNGLANSETGQENTRNYFPVSLAINLQDLKGTVKGIAVEDFKTRPADGDGVQTTTVELESDVSGRGLTKGATTYFIGTLDLKGRQVVIRE